MNGSTVTARDRRRAFAGAVSGHLIEWYDYGVYGFLAVYVGAAFFPSDDPVASLLSTFAVFALSFFIRPIGGLVLGTVADRHGRRPALLLALVLMAAATFAIGLIPSHDSIGAWAPALLVLARCVQGFSAGGEISAVSSLLSERAGHGRRAFATCWVQVLAICGLLIGGLVANGMTYGLGQEQMAEGAWRIPFLVAGPLGLIALYVRLKLEESPAFRELEGEGRVAKTPVGELARHPRGLAQVAGVCVLHSSIFYLVLTFLTSYMSSGLGVGPGQTLVIIGSAGLTAAAIMPFAASLSDRIGRTRFLMPVAVLAIMAMVSLFATAKPDPGPAFFVSVMLVAACFGLFNSSTTALMAELLPTRVRATGIAVGYNVAVAVFGGSAPYIATWLISRTGSLQAPLWFFVATALISLVTLMTVRTSSLHDRSEADPLIGARVRPAPATATSATVD
jgi:MHS family proline/betaine transporter-like MFS transporter